MENMTYSKNELAMAGTIQEIALNKLIAIPFLIKNNFKPIFCNRSFNKIFFLLNLLLLLTIFKTQAQQNPNYPLYANIIYRFTKYINWPDDKKTGDFVIGIASDSPLYDEITSFTANKKVGNQKIIIKRIPYSATSYNCQILVICEDESGRIKKIAEATAGTSTLIVSESDGLARKGSCINFTIVGEHLKLEINKNNIEQRNLDVASEFLDLGTIVK
jgi:uncharacterized protein DUF4154